MAFQTVSSPEATFQATLGLTQSFWRNRDEPIRYFSFDCIAGCAEWAAGPVLIQLIRSPGDSFGLGLGICASDGL